MDMIINSESSGNIYPISIDPIQWIRAYNFEIIISCNVNINNTVYNLYSMWYY